ncbi:hypothetical protein V1477_007419, partial [Vespula maculifrons]
YTYYILNGRYLALSSLPHLRCPYSQFVDIVSPPHPSPLHPPPPPPPPPPPLPPPPPPLLLFLPPLRFFAARRIRMKQFVCKCGPLLGKSCQYIVNGDRVCHEYEEREEEEEEEEVKHNGEENVFLSARVNLCKRYRYIHFQPLIDLNDNQEKKIGTKGSTNCPMDFILKSSA